MKRAKRNGCWPWLGLAMVSIGLCSLVAEAARPRHSEAGPAAQTVEMFAAIDNGQIDVTIIPKDSTRSRVMIKNKTDKPLVVKLPEAFAGVPVMAQFGGGFGGGGQGGFGGGGFGGGSQGFGGGFGGGGFGGGGGLFNIPPEKVGKLKVTTVCLEHGKREPRPAIKYKIVPIDQLTDKAEVHELCGMLGRGQISQRAAQVAAWHLNNDMSWQELAAKRLRSANGTSRPYFSSQELRAAVQIVGEATRLAQQRQQQTPGKEDSLSRYWPQPTDPGHRRN